MILSESPINNRDDATAVIWLTDGSRFTDDDLAAFAGRLGPSEADRYRRFARAERRRQFLVGRLLLRFAIGKQMALPPSAIAVVEQPGGAPQVILPDCGTVQPGFSLSHSGKWVACAVSRNARLGLDIETLDPRRDLIGISRSAFHPAETAWLEKLAVDERLAAFYRLWSAHEALLKLLSNTGIAEHIPELIDSENQAVSRGNGWHSYVFFHPALSCVLCSTQMLAFPEALVPTEVSRSAILAAIRPACRI